MKSFFSMLAGLIICTASYSQYYYKDLVIGEQTASQWHSLRNNKVKTVKVQSFEGNNEPSEGFSVEQKVLDNYSRIITSSKSLKSGSSDLISWYNEQGKIVKTIDTAEDYSSTTIYEYDAAGKNIKINNTSSSAGQFTSSEIHLWKYNDSGNPVSMIRIRNSSDTTSFRFVLDEKGNVVEEHGIRRGQAEPVIYYYYDDKNRLTDIVRYNMKARRLLPTHVFAYTPEGILRGMMIVPEGSNEYQRWFYDYDERGLKTRERVYDKQQQLLGKVEYSYM